MTSLGPPRTARPNATPDPIVAELRQRRLALGISYRTLGQATGYSTSSIHSWETAVRSPAPDTLRRWADALGYDLALLARFDDTACGAADVQVVDAVAVQQACMGRSVRLTDAERDLVYSRLTLNGASAADIATAVGVSARQVERWRATGGTPSAPRQAQTRTTTGGTS